MPQPKNTAANLRTPNPVRFIVCVGWVGGWVGPGSFLQSFVKLILKIKRILKTSYGSTKFGSASHDSWNTTKLGYKRYINVIKWLPELTGPLALTNFNTTQAICISNSNRERADLLRCKTK